MQLVTARSKGWGARVVVPLGLVCALLAWHAGRFVYVEWQDGMEIFNGVSAWLAELIMPVGFGVMALRFLLQALTGPGPEGAEP